MSSCALTAQARQYVGKPTALPTPGTKVLPGKVHIAELL